GDDLRAGPIKLYFNLYDLAIEIFFRSLSEPTLQFVYKLRPLALRKRCESREVVEAEDKRFGRRHRTACRSRAFSGVGSRLAVPRQDTFDYRTACFHLVLLCYIVCSLQRECFAHELKNSQACAHYISIRFPAL